MTKIFKFLFVFSLLAFASQAEAKVCFLPGVFADDGCLDGTIIDSDSCAGYNRTNECPAGYKQEACTTSNGTTKYRCTCDTDNVFTPAQMKDNGYICKTSYDASCGCPRDYTICDRDIYKLAQGDGYCENKLPNTKPNKVCTNPSDNDLYAVNGKRDFYDMCVCSNYPYNCKSTGLTPPSNTYLSCTDSKGDKHYSACDCASAWSETPCDQRTDGCTQVSNKVDKLGTSDKCYLCTSYKCPNAGDINLESYWCDIPQGIETDCEKLGYTYAPDGSCPDGKVTVKCPFNRKYMYCPTTKCNKGFAHTVEECGQTDGYNFGSLDSDGCGQCSAKTCPVYNVKVNETTSVNVQTTIDSNVENCGQTGSKGYYIALSGSFSGEKPCYACAPYSCPSGYTAGVASVNDCDDPEAMIYTPSTIYQGDKVCGKCSAKVCLSGEYAKKSDCEKHDTDPNLHNFCQKNNDTECYYRQTISLGCTYTLDTCPANSVCDSCTKNGALKYKVTSCNPNYYLNGSKCESCVTAATSLKNEHDYAANSYFACVSNSNTLDKTYMPDAIRKYLTMNTCICDTESSCRTNQTNIPGAWDDGHVYYIQPGISQDELNKQNNSYFVRLCKIALTGVVDKVNDFNKKCPNQAITMKIDPDKQCNLIYCGMHQNKVNPTGHGCN